MSPSRGGLCAPLRGKMSCPVSLLFPAECAAEHALFSSLPHRCAKKMSHPHGGFCAPGQKKMFFPRGGPCASGRTKCLAARRPFARRCEEKYLARHRLSPRRQGEKRFAVKRFAAGLFFFCGSVSLSPPPKKKYLPAGSAPPALFAASRRESPPLGSAAGGSAAGAPPPVRAGLPRFVRQTAAGGAQPGARCGFPPPSRALPWPLLCGAAQLSQRGANCCQIASKSSSIRSLRPVR